MPLNLPTVDFNSQLLSAKSMATTFSQIVSIFGYRKTSINGFFGAGVNGAWTVEYSPDYDSSNPGAAHWKDVTSLVTPALTAVSGSAGNLDILWDIPGSALRITFTPSSGSATLDLFVNAQAVSS